MFQNGIEKICFNEEGGAEGGDTGGGAPEGSLRDDALGGAPDTGGDGFVVPEEYKDRSWAPNIKSVEDLYKQFDGQQALLGKKSLPPSADATDEEREAYYEKIRPEKADDYALSSPEGVEFDFPDEVKGAYQELFHKAGLTPQQASMLYNGGIELEMAGQVTEEAKDAEFETMMGDKFGDKVNDAMKVSARLMSGLSEDEKAGLRGLPNEQFVAVIGLLNKVNGQMGEGKMPDNSDVSGGDAGGDGNIEEIRATLAKLRHAPETQDPTHPDNAKNLEEIKRLEALVGAYYK